MVQKILAIHHQDDEWSGIIAERLSQLFPDSIVMTSGGGEKGLIAAHLEQPDVIVIGNILSETENNNLCKRLKTSERTRHIPIIRFKGSQCDLPSIANEEGYYRPAVDVILSEAPNDRELQSHIGCALRMKIAEERLRMQEEQLEEIVQQRTMALEIELEERRRVEEQLRQSEEKFRQLIHASNDGIFLLYQRKFELINKKFQVMFGVTIEDVNHPGFDFSHLVATRSKAVIESIQGRIENGEKLESKYEFSGIARDGKELEVEASVSTIEYKNSVALLGVVRDITHRKQLEIQERRSQKIEAISTLAGGIAHDFNNILSIIRGYTELSLEDIPHDSVLRRNLNHILTASDRAKDLVNQVLTFSRQNEDMQEPVEIAPIVQEALRILCPTLPSHIQLREDIRDDAGFLQADPTQIRQVMMHLCANASHAMRFKGGIIDVSLKAVELGRSDLGILKGLEPGPYIKLSVSDTGHGMEPGVVERIFDPYFTTKATGEGSGMGLAVIHGIVKNHGGDIMVETQPGKGTTFVLYFPRLNVSPQPERKPLLKLPGGKEWILFVDDERMLVYMQQEILERLGYHVVAVSNVFEALDIFSSDPEIFDLVITDQMMPGLTGIQLAQEFLRIRPDIPIILCTGFSESVTRQDALKIGIKEFIMKPVITREIAGIIRNVLDNSGKEG